MRNSNEQGLPALNKMPHAWTMKISLVNQRSNASLSEVSIDQIISFGKLFGDTVNLNVESLRNNQAF